MSSVCLLLLGSSPRSAGEPDPGSFKLLPLPCEILCAPCMSGTSISLSSLALLKVSPAALQSQTLRGLVIPVQDPRAGEPNVGLGTLASWGEPLRL